MTIHSDPDTNHSAARHRAVSVIVLTGLSLAILTALEVMLAGFGSRWGWWHFRAGFMMLQWGGYGGLLAAAVSLIGAVSAGYTHLRRELIASLAGFLIALTIVSILWSWKQTALRVPPIHDITTDMDNPPAFLAILPIRADADNPAGYAGPEIAAQQKKGYPNLGPLNLLLSPAKAFEKALSAADKMCWKIVASNPAEGRIEATDTTFWFGFKDDIVVRITPTADGSRIDVRSVSRVGRSDVGTNAKRIGNYLRKVMEHE
jgi:uncharacterized protein (DUF1499 family)